jgi:protein tyrosine phosphatase (PTP) superfamily phosphohydrolase (DUF442 family)
MKALLTALPALALAAPAGFEAPAAPGPASRRAPARGDLPNLSRPYDWLYRGAQPTPDGLRRLRELGVRTVIDLRDDPADWEPGLARELGMLHVALPMDELRAPPDEDVETFLRLAANTRLYPVFVHCRRGADRTGLAVAVLRLELDRWTARRAVREMLRHGTVQPFFIKYVHDYYQRKHPPERAKEAVS